MALNIRINDDWRLTSDQFNVILNKRYIVDPTKSPNWEKRKADGASPELREEWKEVGYYPTIELAMDALVNKAVLSSDAETIPELLNEITQIRREISAVLNA